MLKQIKHRLIVVAIAALPVAVVLAEAAPRARI